jgi:hypothetical protein
LRVFRLSRLDQQRFRDIADKVGVLTCLSTWRVAGLVQLAYTPSRAYCRRCNQHHTQIIARPTRRHHSVQKQPELEKKFDSTSSGIRADL